MSVSLPPVPKKKSALGCLGCGCLVLALLVILFVGLVAGGCYVGYQKLVAFTSATATTIPTFNGSDDVYHAAQQKIIAFEHDLDNHQAATLQLSADEINTLMSRDPDFIANNVHLFVVLTGNEARLQGSAPTDAFPYGLLKGRYLNFDSTFGLDFNSSSKSLNLNLHQLQIGDQATPEKLMPTMQIEFTVILNTALQKGPETKKLLQQAKSIQVKDGQLVIETQ